MTTDYHLESRRSNAEYKLQLALRETREFFTEDETREIINEELAEIEWKLSCTK